MRCSNKRFKTLWKTNSVPENQWDNCKWGFEDFWQTQVVFGVLHRCLLIVLWQSWWRWKVKNCCKIYQFAKTRSVSIWIAEVSSCRWEYQAARLDHIRVLAVLWHPEPAWWLVGFATSWMERESRLLGCSRVSYKLIFTCSPWAGNRE